MAVSLQGTRPAVGLGVVEEIGAGRWGGVCPMNMHVAEGPGLLRALPWT